MNIQSHIESLLKSSTDYHFSDYEKEYIKDHKMSEVIYYFLTSKGRGFRKWSLNEESSNYIKGVIEERVNNNLPILFTYPFGGYKLHSIANNDKAAWSEFLAVSYIQKYLAPISAVYKPGVEFSFWSDDSVIERVNNIPKATTDSYLDSLKELLDNFNKYSPNNMKLSLERVKDHYSVEDYEKELSEKVKIIEEKVKSMDPERIKRMAITSNFNIKWKGKEDWTKLTEQERDEKVRMGMIYHDAECSLSERLKYVRGEDKVVLFTTSVSKGIAIGTTKSSMTKFWTGIGVLEINGDKIVERVLSPKQYEEVKNRATLIKDLNIIDDRAFESIEVFNERLSFSQKEE